MQIALRVVGWLLTIVLVVAASAVWWLVYRPLPQVDGRIGLAGLHGEVTVDRDSWGVPHIRAQSFEDLAEAQGYIMAQDRLWQMDLLRRVGRGQLSEILGKATLPIDRRFRTFRIGAAADRDATLLDGDPKLAIEAYTRGVNRFIETHQNKLPIEFTLLKYKPEPWKPADSLVIAGYMYQTLTDTWEEELNRAAVISRVGPERAKDLFFLDAAMDHTVVGDPNVADDGSERTGRNPDDEDDDDDMTPDSVLKAANDRSARSFVDLTTELSNSILSWLSESESDLRHGLGSNNWVVSGEHTASGKPLLANDTHLELSMPGIWYEAHLSAPGWNVKGFTLPGAPLVIIGHNDSIAWGFTNNGADVQDLYLESFNPQNDSEYRVRGSWIKAQVEDEIIHVKGEPDEHWKVVITRHGPIVKRDADKSYALRWTATEPGGLANTYNMMGKAQSWEEFRQVMKKVWGPAQNAVYADVQGNIGYLMAARVPIRKKGHGEVPVPGDTDEYEWTGYIPFDQLPQALNPASGVIITANARVVGPNYKPYLTDRWEEPYRTARIWDLLHDKGGLRPADMLKVQTDTYSLPHAFLAEQLVAAAKSSEPKDARTKQLIALAKDWNGLADPDSSVVPFLNTVRVEARRRILEPYLGSETDLYQWRSMTFLQHVLTDRPEKWLPKSFKNYDELLVASADAAVGLLEKRSGSSRIQDWPWKRFNALDMLHPIGREGFLKTLFSISNKPQAGTSYSPRAATPHHGPAMRFIADLSNWDDSILVVPAGQSGQIGSSHYSDQFAYWFEGRAVVAPFSDTAESTARKHTLTLTPAN